MDLPEYTTHINRKAEERKQLMVRPECFIGKFDFSLLVFISIGFSFPIHIIGEAPPCLPQEVKNCVWPAMGKYWIMKFHLSV